MIGDIFRWVVEALVAAVLFYGIFYLAKPELAKYYGKALIAKVKGLFSGSAK